MSSRLGLFWPCSPQRRWGILPRPPVITERDNGASGLCSPPNRLGFGGLFTLSCDLFQVSSSATSSFPESFMSTYYDIRSTAARKATVDFVTVHLAGSTCAHRKRRSLVICKIFRKAPPLFVSERLGFCFFLFP